MEIRLNRFIVLISIFLLLISYKNQEQYKSVKKQEIAKTIGQTDFLNKNISMVTACLWMNLHQRTTHFLAI